VIDAHGDATAAPVHSLLRLLASVPNSGDNHSPFKASQVLRRIVDFVGVGFALLGNESAFERLYRINAELRRANATQRETISLQQEMIASQQEMIASTRSTPGLPGSPGKRRKKS
jgi:hypothetical protein